MYLKHIYIHLSLVNAQYSKLKTFSTVSNKIMFISYYLFSACLCLLLYREYLFIIKLSQEGDRDKEN